MNLVGIFVIGWTIGSVIGWVLFLGIVFGCLGEPIRRWKDR